MNLDEDQNLISEIQLKENSKFLIGSKIVHIIFEITYGSVFIGTIENPLEVGFSAEFFLLLVSYVLCLGSLLLLLQIHQNITESFIPE